MNSSVSINPRVVQVLQKQIADLIKKAPDSVRYALNESDILDIQADIFGPVETPYTGGVFRCKLVLSSEFPRVPPKGFFLTKIFHPNVSEKGEICVNTLKKDWDPTNWSLQHVFEVIRCLLIVPFPESSLNEEAGKLFMEDYEEYAKHARLITDLYAMPKEKPVQKMMSISPEKSRAMDISFENTQTESPVKSGSNSTPSTAMITEFTKTNGTEYMFPVPGAKSERPEEVLMTVTNSLNTNGNNTFEDPMFKKAAPQMLGGMMGSNGGLQVNTNMKVGAGNNDVSSAKKENEKKWKKRI